MFSKINRKMPGLRSGGLYFATAMLIGGAEALFDFLTPMDKKKTFDAADVVKLRRSIPVMDEFVHEATKIPTMAFDLLTHEIGST